ncbi:hypothetical protein [Sphingobacterium tabacisoli]|uniref:Bacteriocin n=1 Tax=Sphingobacterium tabacisoli TaxID=2044855 RepID=A0ABW5KYJ5_9SPHI|nr:hypothetical protein [Sphingobacterium tabacisoli]
MENLTAKELLEIQGGVSLAGSYITFDILLESTGRGGGYTVKVNQKI